MTTPAICKPKFGENTEPKKGGTIYIASKVTVEEKEKAFLFIRAADWLYSSSYVSIWLNGKQIVETESFTKLDGKCWGSSKIPMPNWAEIGKVYTIEIREKSSSKSFRTDYTVGLSNTIITDDYISFKKEKLWI